MPLYDYFCDHCHLAFTAQQSILLRRQAACPACQLSASKRPSCFWISGQGDLRETTDHGCHGPHDCHKDD